MKELDNLSPFCKKCNHTGLLPFIKDEKFIPNAFVFCACYNEYPIEDYSRLDENRNLIDFPCSYDWRAHYQETLYGEFLPPLPPFIKEEEPERYEPQTQRKLYNRIQQLESRLLHMENIDRERRATISKGKHKY